MSKLISLAMNESERLNKQGININNAKNNENYELQNQLDKLKEAVLIEIKQLHGQETPNGKFEFSADNLGYLSLKGGFGAVFFINGSSSKCIAEFGSSMKTSKRKVSNGTGDGDVKYVTSTDPVVSVKTLTPK